MAYFYKNGNGIDSNAYIYVQLQVTRTDYPTYSRFSVKSVAVSDTGTSSFIRGQVTTNQGGTSWTAATGWKSVSYNGTTTLATATFDVTRGASNKTAHIGAYAEGGGTGIYAGGTDYAWLDVTVPKVLAPNAPTGCTATYVSDSQASVSWTNGTADTDHPRDATLVERRDGSNDWAQVASVGGSATSYTDNGISANTQYQYRVRAKNVAGYSDYSASGSIYTTPAAPSSVTLDKTAATTVQVDVTGTWGYAVTYDIESTYDNGATWGSVVTSTSLPYSATVNAGTVKFRVRATRGALASDWTLSASLVTICPPLAPTIVQAPANPTANGSTVTVAWSPNHPDGSSQTSVQIKMTRPNGTDATYTLSTATSWTSPALVVDGTYSVQVHTKGLDPSYGDWSQSVSWVVATPPAVVVTSPATDGADVSALPLDIEWSVTDSTGVSTQRIVIEGAGGEILNRTLAGDVRTLSLTASDVALEDGGTYTIRLRAMGGSGLVTEQTRIFDVAWLAPTPPVLHITEGEGKSATIDVMDTRYMSSGTVLEATSSMMESLTIHGLSVQDGTPTPSSPVVIESVAPRSGQPSIYVCAGDPDGVYTTTPIPVTLRSLPDGTHDEWISGETADMLVQRVGVYSTAGVTFSSVSSYTQFTGSARWYCTTLTDDAVSGVGDANTGFCDLGPYVANANAIAGVPHFYCYAKRIYCIVGGITSSSDAVAWMNANPMTILYPLATPVTTTLAHVTLPYVDGSAWVDAEVTPTIEATFRPVDFPDQPAADSVDVIRVNADGSTWTVASGLSVGDTAIDPLPPLGVPVEYRAVGTAPSGATSSGSYTETIGGREWVLNFGNAAQEHVEFIYNPQADLSLAQGGKGYHFADGGAGKGLPVFYPTTDRDYAGTLKFDTILYGDSDKVLDLCDRYPVAWLRDPFGHRRRAHVAPSVSHGVGQVWPVTLSWDAMRFEEAWDG